MQINRNTVFKVDACLHMGYTKKDKAIRKHLSVRLKKVVFFSNQTKCFKKGQGYSLNQLGQQLEITI